MNAPHYSLSRTDRSLGGRATMFPNTKWFELPAGALMSLQFEKGVTSRKSISFTPRIDRHLRRCLSREEISSAGVSRVSLCTWKCCCERNLSILVTSVPPRHDLFMNGVDWRAKQPIGWRDTSGPAPSFLKSQFWNVTFSRCARMAGSASSSLTFAHIQPNVLT